MILLDLKQKSLSFDVDNGTIDLKFYTDICFCINFFTLLLTYVAHDFALLFTFRVNHRHYFPFQSFVRTRGNNDVAAKLHALLEFQLIMDALEIASTAIQTGAQFIFLGHSQTLVHGISIEIVSMGA